MRPIHWASYRRAAARKQPMAAVYERPAAFALSSCVGQEGRPAPCVGLSDWREEQQWPAGGSSGEEVFGAVWLWRNSVTLNCALMDGAPNRARQVEAYIDEVDFDTDAQPGDDPQNGQ